MILNTLFLIKEFLPFSFGFSDQFQINNVYNWMDFFILIGIYIFLLIDRINYNDWIDDLHFFMILILGIRTILELKIFDPFRHLAGMILRVYIDIIPFIIFLILYMLIYATLQLLNFKIYE